LNTEYIKDLPRLINTIHRFVEYVKFRDNTDSDFIDFGNQNSFLGREEGYKTKVFSKANDVLQYGKWKLSMVGTGIILAQAREAISKSDNLIFVNTKIDLLNKLTPNHKDYLEGSEQVIYDIFKSSGYEEEKLAFENAKAMFSGVYNRLAYLFFIKSCSAYLPISTGRFDNAFKYLNIDYKTSSNCSWENYNGYIQIISEVRDYLESILNAKEVRLLDAHSFLWIVAQDGFQKWKPNDSVLAEIEEKSEKDLSEPINKGKPGKSQSLTTAYKRSAEVVKMARNRAKGFCQLCNSKAPFKDKKGEPYLEVHHIIWLSRGGEDSTDNAVALCPNCHKKMHIVDDAGDIEYLSNKAKATL